MHLDLFASVSLIVAAAALLVFVMQKLRQSAIVAYLALGLLIGPSGLDVLRSSSDVQHLAEFGVIFLLFFVGLDFHLSALQRMLRLATLGGFGQLTATTAVLGGAGMLCGFPADESLLLGFCAALSSTAIVLKEFEDRRQSDTAVAQTSLGILIGQDLIALLVLAILPFVLAGDAAASNGPGPALRLAIMGVAIPALVLIARRGLPVVFRRAAIARNQEVFGLCSLAACLLVAVLAHWAGASPALGAFLGGLVVADSPFAHQMRADLATLKNLTLGFFFVSVGMIVDLDFIVHHGAFLALALPAVLVSKTAVTGGVLRLLRRPSAIAVGSGLALSQIGEFALVLPGLAHDLGFLADDRYQTLLTLTVLTMLPAPILVGWSIGIGRRLTRRRGVLEGSAAAPVIPAASATEELPAPVCPRARAVVVGYGPVGRTVARLLIRFGVDPCVVDLHPDTIDRLRALGREAVYGDAGRREVLHAAGVCEARYLAVTLPDFASRSSIIATAHALNPSITIVSRARYLNERTGLELAGAQDVGIEETEVAGELARLLLRRLDVPAEVIEQEVASLRQEITVRTGFTQILSQAVDPAARALKNA